MVFDDQQLSEEALSLVAARFRCLGEPMRLRILSTLKTAGELTVAQLVERLGANQANVSKHLRVLVDTGVLGRRPHGTAAYYSIVDPAVIRLCETVCDGITAKLLTQARGFGLTLGSRGSGDDHKKRPHK